MTAQGIKVGIHFPRGVTKPGMENVGHPDLGENHDFPILITTPKHWVSARFIGIRTRCLVASFPHLFASFLMQNQVNLCCTTC